MEAVSTSDYLETLQDTVRSETDNYIHLLTSLGCAVYPFIIKIGEWSVIGFNLKPGLTPAVGVSEGRVTIGYIIGNNTDVMDYFHFPLDRVMTLICKYTIKLHNVSKYISLDTYDSWEDMYRDLLNIINFDFSTYGDVNLAPPDSYLAVCEKYRLENKHIVPPSILLELGLVKNNTRYVMMHFQIAGEIIKSIDFPVLGIYDGRRFSRIYRTYGSDLETQLKAPAGIILLDIFADSSTVCIFRGA